MNDTDANSSHVVQDGQRSTASVPHTSIVLLVGLVVLAFVVGGIGTLAVLRIRMPRASAAPVSSTHVMAAVVEVKSAVPVTVSVEALPTKAPSNMTVVRFTRSPISHRVWVDDALVGSDDAPMELRCGRRTIKIGSQGKPRSVELPCGGDLTLP